MVDVVRTGVTRVKLFGDWDKLANIGSIGQRFQRSVTQSLIQQAHILRTGVVKGIASGAPGGKPFAPLSAMTIAMRKFKGFGGTKPLNRTGSLRGSVVVHRAGGSGPGGAVFIGILRQSRSKDGKSLVNIGEIHEYGRTWTQAMTAKSRRFLFAVMKKSGIAPSGSGGKGGGAGKVTITIPARPFLGPVFEQESPKIAGRFWEGVAKGMGYDLGRPK